MYSIKTQNYFSSVKTSKYPITTQHTCINVDSGFVEISGKGGV